MEPKTESYIDDHNPEVQGIKGIGPKRVEALHSIGIYHARDLLYYFPRRYLDRSTIVPFQKMYDYADQIVTGVGTIVSIVIVGKDKQRLVVTLNDVRGVMECVFFQGIKYWKTAFDVGEVIAVSGRVQVYGRKPSMVHPDIDRLSDEDSVEFINTGGIIPVYPSSEQLEKVGLNRHGGFRKLLRHVLQEYLTCLEEFLPRSIIAQYSFLRIEKALHEIHFPRSHDALGGAQQRLKFDELFLLQLQIAYQRRTQIEEKPGIAFTIENERARKLIASLPFQLTAAQKRVMREIAADMHAAKPMNRLLQGDVGSGKTVVALVAMLVAIGNGYQVAFMVPTEILAEQHFRTLLSLIQSEAGLNDFGVRIELLVGQQGKSRRTPLLGNIANGSVDIVVGTHALIQKGVQFHKLGFIVIDEQHRFGVIERAVLREKGLTPDVLVMTATPIPRTFAMTLYGDLDVSTIDEMPLHRKPVKTVVRFEENRVKVFDFLRAEIRKSHQVFVVFPLVEESEKIDLKAATGEYERFREDAFREYRIGLLHGKMKPHDKDEIMRRFKAGEIQILVTTTVIEVGIDVPAATVMLIEHAERFGLSQLHQLRGRVGRGADQSYCILMTDRKFFYGGGERTQDDRTMLSSTRARLQTMADTTDGFKIAEVDLELRGPGDMWGTKQHGFPELKIANLLTDQHILIDARREAFRIVETDPHLRTPEHEPLKKIIEPLIKNAMSFSTVA